MSSIDRSRWENLQVWDTAVSRRRFLSIMGASLALAALSGCAPMQADHIVPTVAGPADFDQAGVQVYASGLDLCGELVPILARTTSGRPIKLDGNPQHPAYRGGSDVWLQGSLLSLYDPDRSQSIFDQGHPGSWDAFTTDLLRVMAQQSGKKGAGLRLLTEPVSSPTVLALMEQLKSQYPGLTWHTWEPLGRDNERAGMEAAFGRDRCPVYHIDKADAVISLDADFLHWGRGHIQYASDFGRGRQVRRGGAAPKRLYCVHGTANLTSANADWRLATPDVPSVAAALVVGNGPEPLMKVLRAGRSLVVAGQGQPPWVHAAAAWLNQQYGNAGVTVSYIEPPVTYGEDLPALVTALDAGQVDALFIFGVNPVYDAPADLHFDKALARAGWRAHLGTHRDETAIRCEWHVPAAHSLEAWGDGRAYDGTLSVIQPMIVPLFGGRTVGQMLAAMLGNAGQPAYDIVHDSWQGKSWWKATDRDFDTAWRQILHDGYVAATAYPPVSGTPRAPGPAPAPHDTALTVAFRPDPSLHDGRFANNGWLQELPRPLTELTWENAILLSPATAEAAGVGMGDIATIVANGTSATMPVWVLPQQSDRVATIHLGYGRTQAGNVGNDVGVNVYPMRTTATLWQAPATIRKAPGGPHFFASTQHHHSMSGRDPAKRTTWAEFQTHPQVDDEPDKPPSLYPEYQYEGYKWGMVIDLSACIGCKACTIACQAENNIPVVGRDQVLRRREMHWIRVDSYWDGQDDVFQPVPCMQCENAPCELVCPVGATVHDTEGINDMVYNRCVGTRYCSNNCPYKVRRFNFLQYSPLDQPVLELAFNPDVTVRPRGVMEKCTYCIQRIDKTRAQAEIENRYIRDQEVTTACQDACPTGAIMFGNLNDPKSVLNAWRGQPHNYYLLAELDTWPRTSYLARVRALEV